MRGTTKHPPESSAFALTLNEKQVALSKSNIYILPPSKREQKGREQQLLGYELALSVQRLLPYTLSNLRPCIRTTNPFPSSGKNEEQLKPRAPTQHCSAPGREEKEGMGGRVFEERDRKTGADFNTGHAEVKSWRICGLL